MSTISDFFESKRFKKINPKIGGFSLFFAIIGGVLMLNNCFAGIYLVNIGGIGLAVYLLFCGFYPLKEELDWTLVFPQLAGMNSDNDEAPILIEPKKVINELKNEIEKLKEEIERLKVK